MTPLPRSTSSCEFPENEDRFGSVEHETLSSPYTASGQGSKASGRILVFLRDPLSFGGSSPTVVEPATLLIRDNLVMRLVAAFVNIITGYTAYAAHGSRELPMLGAMRSVTTTHG